MSGECCAPGRDESSDTRADDVSRRACLRRSPPGRAHEHSGRHVPHGRQLGVDVPGRRRGAGARRRGRSVPCRSLHSRPTRPSPRSSTPPVGAPMPSATAGRSCSGACCPTTSPTRAAWWAPNGGARCSAPTGVIPRVLTPTSADRAAHPVVHVSWNDASAFCRVDRNPPPDRSGVGARGTRRDRGHGVSLG